MPPRASVAEKGKAPAAPGDGGRRPARGAGAAAHDEAEPKDAVATTRRGGTRKAPRSSQAVGAGVGGSLALSGPFNKLDVELTIRIFSSLDTRTRLRCVSEVCKGWRSLRRNPALWASISLSPPDFHHSSNLLAFIAGPRSPLPSPDCVQSLELVSAPGKKAFNTSSLKTALKTLSSATSVAISCSGNTNGVKISPDSFAVLTKQRAAPLKSLKLGNIKGLVVEDALLDILASSPALTELEFDGTVTDAWVAAAGSRASAACGALSLTDLRVGDHRFGFSSSVNVAAFCNLGSTFPHLAELRTHSVRGMAVNSQSGDQYVAPGSLRAWAPLSALRSLHINNLCHMWDIHSLKADDVHEFIKRVVDAAPGLRSLHVSRGTEHESMRELVDRTAHVYAPMFDLCGPDLCGIGSLQHLEELSLAYIGLKPATCTGSFPKLERLVLDHCGPHAAASASAFVGAALALKRLEVKGLERTAPCGETGPGADGFVTLASALLTELHLDCGSDITLVRNVNLLKKVRETSTGLGHALRDMAARDALPALRVLTVSYDFWQHSERLPSDTFQVAHPWPKLERLELPDAGPLDATPLSALRAPLLSQLTLHGIVRNVVVYERFQTGPLYNSLRVNLPSLPPPRHEERDERRPVAPDAAAAGGAAAGSDSD